MRLAPATLTTTLLIAMGGCAAYTTPSAGYVTDQHRRPYPQVTPPATFAHRPAPVAQRPVAPQPTAVAHASPPPSSSPQVAFRNTPGENPNAQRLPDMPQPKVFEHTAASDLVPDAQRPEYDALRRGGNPGQFNLYGQVDGTTPGSRAGSPMDAQDNLRRVTFTTEGADFDVELAPSGQWIYFASTRHRETADIYKQKVGGTAVTQLTSDPSNDVMPAISPDGKTLAFCSDRSGSWDIYLTEADGGQVVKITNDDTHNIHPSFSRDGSQLVYSSYGSQAGVWELVLIDLARPTKKRIIGHGLFPSWSPTDDTIVFQRARERGSRWFSVWTVDIVDGEAISPTEIAVSSNAAVITPEWSPDGENIVFCTVIDPQNDDPSKPTKADVWVIGRDGTGRSKLTTGSFANLQPAWSPDGDVYFISDRGVEGIENIWAVRPAQAVYLARSQRGAGNTEQASVPTP